MKQSLYDRPDVHEALYAGRPYGEEVEFALDRAPGADRALVVGRGTGEHARRLEAAGLEVVGVGPSAAMVERAREKSDATFRVGELPDLPVDGEFDLVVAATTALNHLAPGELEPALAALAERVGEEGVLILDTGEFPDMDAPALRIASGPEADCAWLHQFIHTGDRRVRMEAVVFHGESWFLDRRDLTRFENEEVGVALTDLGFVVKREDWYPDPTTAVERSVFVAQR